MDPTDEGRVTVCDRSAGSDAVLDVGHTMVFKIGIAFAVAAGGIYLVGGAVGWDAVRRALTTGEYQWLVLACLSTLVGLVAWSKAWQIVFSIVDIDMRLPRVTVTYLAATFANYVTPFGQVGGEPVTAYILSREVDVSYEDSLTSVITVDLLNLIPFFSFAVLGLGVLTLRTDLPPSARFLAYGLALLALIVPVIVYVGWNHRWVVKTAVSIVAIPAALATNRLSVDDVHRRTDRFYTSLEKVVDDPRRLLYALVFSYVGWLFFTLPLFFAGLVLGISIDPLLVLFIVPASTLAGFVPTPGGLGGVEVALVALLVGLASLTGGQAFALAVLYRFASYWFTLGIGILPTLYVVARM